jgi:hypothetical protein
MRRSEVLILPLQSVFLGVTITDLKHLIDSQLIVLPNDPLKTQ